MSDQVLDGLLDQWSDARDAGTELAVEELTPDPALRLELKRRIDVLVKFERLLRDDDADTLNAAAGDTSVIEPEGPTRRLPSLPKALGEFKPLRILGMGGMGAVFLAEDTRLNRRVAIKVLRPELACDPAARTRFLLEAQAMAAVEHEHVTSIYAVGEDNEAPYIVMPLLSGESLEQRLGRAGKLPLPEACRIARQAALGLAAAHSKGLIHRDVKPGNVWLEGASNKVKLLDFGLARAVAGDQRLTVSGAVLGTPSFMAPEQAEGEEITARADLFSLGCMLYQMTTGRQPFAGATLLATLRNLATVQPAAPRDLDPQISQELSQLILQLLSKSPHDRPASAGATAEALAACESQLAASADGAASSAVCAVTPTVLKSPPRRSSAPRMMLGLALAAAGIVALGIVYRVVTDRGTVIVEIEGDEVAAKLEKNGIAVEDEKTGRKWSLIPGERSKIPSGAYRAVADEELRLIVRDDSGAEFTTTEFKVNRGQEIALRVTLAPQTELEAAKVEPSTWKSIPGGESPLDRLDPARIAEGEHTPWQPKELVAVIGQQKLQHWGGINDISISPNGAMFASVSKFDGTVRLWMTDTGEEIATLRDARSLQSAAMCFSPDGNCLAVYPYSGPDTILYDVSQLPPRELARLPGSFCGDPFHPDGEKQLLLNHRLSDEYHLWNYASEKPTVAGEFKLRGSHGDLEPTIFWLSAERVFLITRDQDDLLTFALWNLSEKPAHEIAQVPVGSRSLAVSSDRKFLAVLDRNVKQLKAFQIDSDRLVELAAFPESLLATAHDFPFVSDTHSLLYLPTDGTWRIRNLEDNSEKTWKASSGAHPRFARRTGVHVSTISENGLQIHKQQTDGQWRVQHTARASGGTLETSRSGFLFSMEQLLTIWDLTGDVPTGRPVPSINSALGLCFEMLPDGRIAGRSPDGQAKVAIFDPARGTNAEGMLLPSDDYVNLSSTRGTRDGKRVLLAGHSFPTRLVSLDGNRATVDATLDDGGSNDLFGGFSQSGSHCWTGAPDYGIFRLWDLRKGTPRFVKQWEGVWSHAFAYDQNLLALGFSDGNVRLFNIEPQQPEETHCSRPSTVPACGVALLPGSGKILCADMLGGVRLLELPYGTVVQEWTWGGPTRLVAAEDGRHVFAINYNDTAYVLRFAKP